MMCFGPKSILTHITTIELQVRRRFLARASSGLDDHIATKM